MSRADCISNRNIRIISAYVFSKTGSIVGLFEDLPYPSHIYSRPEDYFLNEQEWTTLGNFKEIFLRARKLVDERDFYFRCGFSTAKLSSWGRLQYFAKLFSSPSDGYKKLSFFNRQFNDTKDIRIGRPPYYDKSKGLMRTTVIIAYHEDMDPNEDLMGDLYTRGILSAIPTLWDIPPAEIELLMAPYDPVKLFSKAPLSGKRETEFGWRGSRLFSKEGCGAFEEMGILVELLPEEDNPDMYLGRYKDLTVNIYGPESRPRGLLLTRPLDLGETIVPSHTLLMAPYFVLDITYERLSLKKRFEALIPSKARQEHTQKALMETIEELRSSIEEKRRAYALLEAANRDLKSANEMLKANQERMEYLISEKTSQLEKAREELSATNRRLEEEVAQKSVQLQRMEFLKRYLSPHVINYLMERRVDDIVFQRKFITILFADIRGFSSIAELNEPEDVMEILNLYFDNTIKMVHEYKATIYKILGDGIIVLFNDIIDIDDHAYKAVMVASKIHDIVTNLNKDLHEDLSVGIGINSGYVSLGSIGSSIFKDYAVIGKEMNLAARLQAIAKGGEIIITKRTLSQLQGRVSAEPRGTINVKGMVKPVEIYKVKTIIGHAI